MSILGELVESCLWQLGTCVLILSGFLFFHNFFFRSYYFVLYSVINGNCEFILFSPMPDYKSLDLYYAR